MPVPPRPAGKLLLTVQVPPLMLGTPVLALVLIPVPPYWAPMAVAFQVPAVKVPTPVRLP